MIGASLFTQAAVAGVVGCLLYAGGLGVVARPQLEVLLNAVVGPSRAGVSTTLTPPRTAPPHAYVPLRRRRQAPGPGRSGPRDRTVIMALALCFAALTALTWRKWGVPEIDAGAELTTADLVKHGAVAYRDVRYYYGPLGLYSLALSFKVFGSSFTTAFAFGLVQTAAILAAFYALARHWLVPLTAGLASAVLLAIGFSGTAFNFILPHTDSATFGVLCLLLMLLALTRERVLLAGIAAGLVALTRPEFLAVAVGAALAYVIATWRVSGRAAAWRAAWRLALGAIAIPLAVYAWFAEQAGLSRMVTENLWPVKFLHAGVKTEQSWMPVSLAGFAGLVGRAVVYGGLLAALVASVNGWRSRRRPAGAGEPAAGAAGNGSEAGRRLAWVGERSAAPTDARGRPWLALWPLAATVGGLVLVDLLLRASGVLAGERAAIELEVRHLVLGMSWLPALGIAVAALAAVRLVREIPGLTSLITDNGRFQFNSWAFPFASHVAFSSDHPSSVAIGTQQNGLFVSADRGATWSKVPKSERATAITSVEWMSATDAFVSTLGRGLWKLTGTPIVKSVSSLCAVQPCLLKYVFTGDPGPERFQRGIVVFEGEIMGARVEDGVLRELSVAPQTSVGFVGSPVKLAIRYTNERIGLTGITAGETFALPSGRLMTGLALDERGGPVGALYTGAKIPLAEKITTRPGVRSAEARFVLQQNRSPTLSKPYISLAATKKAMDDIAPKDRLTLTGERMPRDAVPEIVLDGRPMAKPDRGRSGVVKTTIKAPKELGLHTVIVRDANTKRTIDGAVFVVRPRDVD